VTSHNENTTTSNQIFDVLILEGDCDG